MCRELFQVARRRATDQIVGRRDDAHRTFAELANRELGSTQQTDPDGEVGALLQEIDYLIGSRRKAVICGSRRVDVAGGGSRTSVVPATSTVTPPRIAPAPIAPAIPSGAPIAWKDRVGLR